jgi:hypothetical protein
MHRRDQESAKRLGKVGVPATHSQGLEVYGARLRISVRRGEFHVRTFSVTRRMRLTQNLSNMPSTTLNDMTHKNYVRFRNSTEGHTNYDEYFRRLREIAILRILGQLEGFSIFRDALILKGQVRQV